MSDWQPIESAPKDGRYILAWESKMTTPCMVSWAPEIDDSDLYIEARWEDYGEGFVVYPTHWMPLPAPPNSGEVKS